MDTCATEGCERPVGPEDKYCERCGMKQQIASLAKENARLRELLEQRTEELV